MKRPGLGFCVVLALTGCSDIVRPEIVTSGGDTSVVGGGAPREYMVLGSSMGFEECRAQGGLIIRDVGSPMVACDPRVRGDPVPADEFDHPGSPVPQTSDVTDD